MVVKATYRLVHAAEMTPTTVEPLRRGGAAGAVGDLAAGTLSPAWPLWASAHASEQRIT